MIRVLVILLVLSSPLMGQNISFGVHGCAAWSKLELSNEIVTVETEDYSSFYGAGVDVSFKPAMSPVGVEAGFTYLVRTEEVSGISATYKTHPLYVNGKFYINPMFYVGGGVNYTFWNFEIADLKLEDINSQLGFQFGGGVETGAGSIRLYGNAFYMIQKGKYSPDVGSETDIEVKSIQVRAGVRFGG